MLEPQKKSLSNIVERSKVWQERETDSKKNKFGEPVDSAYLRKVRLQIGFIGILMIIGIVATCYYVPGGIYIGLGLIGVVIGGLIGLYWGIKIKSTLFMSVELAKYRTVDEVGFYTIPDHFLPLWVPKGIPILLKNKFDHSDCYLVNKVDTENRTYECGFSSFDKNINYLLDKNCYIDMKDDWLLTKDQCRKAILSADLTAEVRFAILLGKLEEVIFVDPSLLIINRNFGQDKYTTSGDESTAKKNFSIYGTVDELEQVVMNHRSELAKLEKEKEELNGKDSGSNGK